MGRPKIYNDLSQPTTIRVELNILQQLDQRAASLGITRSAAIKQAVAKWLKP
jgi:predicted transcriptional regulator